ncbi:MAG TPA: hypothetical protein DHV62_06220 [Elusimicrobia bacterium]|jgi:hypothetical protein|nr:hypothetical protein [Elusimicrobiota bacterium]
MDIEFHYYITYVIALRSGFKPDEAYIIAYSSQYTDSNSAILEISIGSPNVYSNYISQTANILKPKKELMRIYPIFHFMPGTTDDIMGNFANRRDGKLHLLNTIPANQNAQRLLQEALDSKDLYRIGIATHMYSDTFAHQNFVGYYDSFNSMKGILEEAIPDIGHADAKHNPDWPGLLWEDARLVPSQSSIDNKKRFLKAAGHLFQVYHNYIGPSSTTSITYQNKNSVIAEIDKAIGDYDETNEQKDNRISRYKSLCRSIIGENFIDYEENAWFNEAIRRKIGFFKWNYEWRGNYKQSHWFNFQEAVKKHQKAAKNILLNTFQKMELENL